MKLIRLQTGAVLTHLVCAEVVIRLKLISLHGQKTI